MLFRNIIVLATAGIRAVQTIEDSTHKQGEDDNECQAKSLNRGENQRKKNL